MIKKISTDVVKLSKKSVKCYFSDIEVHRNKTIIQDMLDTIEENKEICIGLAASQIGEHRRIIIVVINKKPVVMVNPVSIPVKSAGIKKYKEGCMSFPERMYVNRVIKRRYKKIKVTYQLVTGAKMFAIFKGLPAVMVQHEIDHLNGIAI